MIIEGNKLTPEQGYQYITNGTVYSTLVYLGKYDSPSNWHDTNDQPPATIEITDTEALNIITGGL